MLKEEGMGNNWWRLERIAIKVVLSKTKLFSPKVFQSSAPTFSLMQSTVAALQPGFFFCTFLLRIAVVK